MVTGMIKKFKNSFKYSCNGLKATFKREYSFQIEIVAIPILIILLILLPCSPVRKMVMMASYLIIPCLELLNSAIEKLADRLTTEHDVAIEFVKDAASASILLALIQVVIIWIGCLCF